jgi:hypothetical protein
MRIKTVYVVRLEGLVTHAFLDLENATIFRSQLARENRIPLQSSTINEVPVMDCWEGQQ